MRFRVKMTRRRALRSQLTMAACLCLVWVAATCAVTLAFQRPAAVPQRAVSSSASPARDFVTKYCVACHNQKLATAQLMLDKADAEHVSNSAATWENVIVKLRSRT